MWLFGGGEVYEYLASSMHVMSMRSVRLCEASPQVCCSSNTMTHDS